MEVILATIGFFNRNAGAGLLQEFYNGSLFKALNAVKLYKDYTWKLHKFSISQSKIPFIETLESASLGAKLSFYSKLSDAFIKEREDSLGLSKYLLSGKVTKNAHSSKKHTSSTRKHHLFKVVSQLFPNENVLEGFRDNSLVATNTKRRLKLDVSALL
jgi:hypothetical protein